MAYERIVHQEIKSRKEEWREFRGAELKCVTEVCGCSLVGQVIIKRSECWDD